MNKFRIEITSVPDREKLVAEIWLSENLIAEINQEAGELQIEFFFRETNIFDLNELLLALEIAKSKLRES